MTDLAPIRGHERLLLVWLTVVVRVRVPKERAAATRFILRADTVLQGRHCSIRECCVWCNVQGILLLCLKGTP